jgi:hypothetical protein
MAAACDGDECDPPPAAKDLAGREQQPPGPSARSPAARGPTTANSREGSGTHHKPGQPSAIDPCNSSNSTPPYFKNAGWPQQARGRWGGRRSSGPASAQQNTQAQLRGFKTLQVEQHPPRTERLCMPNAPAFSCGPRERSPRGRQLQRLVGHRLVKPKTPFWIRRTFSAFRSREERVPNLEPQRPPEARPSCRPFDSARD